MVRAAGAPLPDQRAVARLTRMRSVMMTSTERMRAVRSARDCMRSASRRSSLRRRSSTVRSTLVKPCCRALQRLQRAAPWRTAQSPSASCRVRARDAGRRPASRRGRCGTASRYCVNRTRIRSATFSHPLQRRLRARASMARVSKLARERDQRPLPVHRAIKVRSIARVPARGLRVARQCRTRIAASARRSPAGGGAGMPGDRCGLPARNRADRQRPVARNIEAAGLAVHPRPSGTGMRRPRLA